MSYIDLEDEDLINADENELHVEEENLLVDGDENGNEDQENAGIDPAPSKDATKVAPKKRIVRNPQPKLNYDRLKGRRGLLALESSFENVKFKGKGYEKEDLDLLMSQLEQWTHRLFPKFTFDDTLQRLEQLGHKKQVSVSIFDRKLMLHSSEDGKPIHLLTLFLDINNFMNRIRLGMVDETDTFVQNDIVEDKDEPEIDPFDRLTEANPLGHSTQIISQNTGIRESTLTEEQRERMIRNRLLAEERRLARMKAKQGEQARQQLNQPPDSEMQVEYATQLADGREQNVHNLGEYSSQREERSQLQVSSQLQPSNYWATDEHQNINSLVLDQMEAQTNDRRFEGDVM